MKDQKDIWSEFDEEFGIHFSPSELQFAKEFIKQNFIEKREVREEIEKLKQLTYPINVEKQDEKWNYLNGYNQALQDVLDNLE